MFKNWERFLPLFLRRQFEGRKNLKKITENIGWLFFDKVLRMGMGLVVGVWVARYLGPEQYGILNYALAFSAIFGVIAGMGLDGIIVRELVKTPEKKNEILGSAFIIKLAGSIFTITAASVVIHLIKPNDSLTFWLVLLTSTGFVFNAFMVIDGYNQAHLQSKYTVLSLNSAFLITALCKVALILIRAPLIAFAFAGVFDVILGMVLLVFFFYRRKESLFAFTPQIKKMKNLLKDSWPLILSGFAAIIYMRVDQIMIGEMLGNQAVGVYSAAVRISEVWYFIALVITASVFPSIIESKKENKKLYHKRVQQLYRLVIWLAIGIALPMSFLSDWLIQILYGADYINAASVLSILVWAGVFVFLGLASGKWFMVENLQIFSTFNATIGAIINIILNYFFIQKFGILGAAWASFISYFFATYLCLLFWNKTKVNFINISKGFFFLKASNNKEKK